MANTRHHTFAPYRELARTKAAGSCSRCELPRTTAPRCVFPVTMAFGRRLVAPPYVRDGRRRNASLDPERRRLLATCDRSGGRGAAAGGPPGLGVVGMPDRRALGVVCFALGGSAGSCGGQIVSSIALSHATALINSLAHVWGSRRFETDDTSQQRLARARDAREGWHSRVGGRRVVYRAPNEKHLGK